MLTGATITLRSLCIQDMERTLRWRNDPAIKAAALMHPYAVTREQEQDWFSAVLHGRDNAVLYFAIELRETAECIGYVCLDRINHIHGTCRFGIVIGEDGFRGKGIGREALELVRGYVFSTLNLRKVTLEVAAFNEAARRLYEKVGFVVEGTLRQQVYHDGAYHDVLLMALFR